MSYRSLDARGGLLALAVSVFWAANPVAIKVGLEDAPPLRLAALRFLVAGVAVGAWAWATGRARRLAPAPEERRPLLVLGLLLGVQIATMNVATDLTTAGRAAILLNSYAVHTAVLAHFLVPGDRLTPRRLAGILVAYAGVVLLFAGGAALRRPVALGDALMLASALVLAERTVYLARAVQRLDPVKLLAAQLLVGGALFVVGTLALEPAPTRWTKRLLAVVGFQGLVVTGFNFAVNLWLLKRYRPSALAACFLTQPILGVLLAALIAGEPLGLELALASLAVAAGVGLTAR